MDDAVPETGRSCPRDAVVKRLDLLRDLAGSLAEDSEVSEDRGSTHGVNVDLVGGSFADQAADGRCCVAHLAQQQQLTLHRAAARR